MATAAIKPRAEAACRLCRGEAVKTKGQLSILNSQFAKELRSVALLALGKFLRGALEDDISAICASFGTEVNDVVGALDNLHIMLHNHYRMPRSNQCVKRPQKAVYVVYMQSRSRLIEDKHHMLVRELLCQVRSQLNSLTLTARKG